MMSLLGSQYLDELISLIVGQITPLLISFFKGNTWSDRQAMILTIVICTIIGALSSLASHALVLHETMTVDDWIGNALVVYTSATASFKLYFQKTEANATAESIGPFNKE